MATNDPVQNSSEMGSCLIYLELAVIEDMVQRNMATAGMLISTTAPSPLPNLAWKTS